MDLGRMAAWAFKTSHRIQSETAQLVFSGIQQKARVQALFNVPVH